MVAQLVIALEPDLDLSRLVGLAGDLPESWIADVGVRRAELDAIQRIKGL